MKDLVIICDVPWKFSKPGPKVGKGAVGHYPLMSDKDIMKFYVELAKKTRDYPNVAMFNWCVNSKLDLYFDIVRELKSKELGKYRHATKAFTLIKLNEDGTPWKGIGNYTGSNEEPCMLLVKGSMPPTEKLVHSVIQIKKKDFAHSEKPQEAKDRIMRMYPKWELDCPYPVRNHWEFFARKQDLNWKQFGNEINGKDIFEELENLK